MPLDPISVFFLTSRLRWSLDDECPGAQWLEPSRSE